MSKHPNNIKIYNRNENTYEDIQESVRATGDTRFTDLLLGGLLGYSIYNKGHQPMEAHAQTPPPQQAQQPRIPYPPQFIPNPQFQKPISQLNEIMPYLNRYIYFWPQDDHTMGFWLFVTFIDGLGIRGYHFNGQQFTPIQIQPQTLSGFYA